MAQSNNYYYYKGEKVNLTIDYNKSNQKGSLYFKTQNNSPSIPISDIFYVKLHQASDLVFLREIARQKNVKIVHKNTFMPLWYKLQLHKGSKKSSLEVCNEFYETGYFANVDPAFMFNFKNNCTNDSNFGSLWGLNNTTNPNIDINACAAWGITEGNGINVAVLDNGIDRTHNDLNANLSSLSYDSEAGRSPSKFTNGKDHGTHVAGTIAAIKDNNLQVVGVAPKSKIIGISNSFPPITSNSEKLADGINWAVQNGAHIINNSWGAPASTTLRSAVLENAIDNALANGRNGLGTIIVFSAGNDNGSPVGYPANHHPNILAVGSITRTGFRSSFSNIGSQLDVVAPGSGILSTISNQGTATWNGTSMAAPHVTGVAALILSVNPNLTVTEVNTIIEETAQKVGSYSYTSTSGRPNGTWNNQMGYGLVDAYQAVLLAQSYGCVDDLTITQNVPNGQTDVQQAKITIEAINTIASGGTANYSAGTSVTLKSGFHAVSGANFMAFTESCDTTSRTNSIASSSKVSENQRIENIEAESEITNIDTFLNIYPNPNDGLFHIESSSIIKYYTLTDIYGKEIIAKQPSKQALNVDISGFPTGIYFLKLQIENGETINKKILKK